MQNSIYLNFLCTTLFLLMITLEPLSAAVGAMNPCLTQPLTKVINIYSNDGSCEFFFSPQYLGPKLNLYSLRYKLFKPILKSPILAPELSISTHVIASPWNSHRIFGLTGCNSSSKSGFYEYYNPRTYLSGKIC